MNLINSLQSIVQINSQNQSNYEEGVYQSKFTHLQSKTDELVRTILLLEGRRGYEGVSVADAFDLKFLASEFVDASLLCSRDLLQRKQSGRPDEGKTQEFFNHLANTKSRISTIYLSAVNRAETDCKRKLEILKERRDSISIADKFDMEMLMKDLTQVSETASALNQKISDLYHDALKTL